MKNYFCIEWFISNKETRKTTHGVEVFTSNEKRSDYLSDNHLSERERILFDLDGMALNELIEEVRSLENYLPVQFH